jgi:hypothetical protein
MKIVDPATIRAAAATSAAKEMDDLLAANTKIGTELAAIREEILAQRERLARIGERLAAEGAVDTAPCQEVTERL